MTQGKPIEPQVHHAPTVAIEAPDVAGDVTAHDPFGGAPGWIMSGPFGVPASAHGSSEQRAKHQWQIVNPLGAFGAFGYTVSWVWIA